MNLENKIGPLAKTYPQLEPDTIQHSFEITNNRRTDKSLRNQWFWTADFAMYTLEKGNVYLHLATRENNLIFKNIKEAAEQLIKTQNYAPEKKDIETVINSESTLKIDLSKLHLKKYNDEFSYFEIDTAKYDKTLNREQRKFAERVYGQGDDFKENMKMLKDDNMGTTRIYVLNPIYVKAHAEKGSAIVWACRLGRFDGISSFGAGGRSVGGSGGALRGVPKIAEGAQKIKVFDIESILKETGHLDDYAHSQITKLRNIFEQGGYEIVKRG